MRDLYEIGIVFRGFVLVNTVLRDLPSQKKESGVNKDLRGAFISAITTFAENAFTNTTLEYLEMGNFLFAFRIAEILSADSKSDEPIIIYGLIEKKKKADKYMKKFFEKTNPILELFVQKYNHKNFSELDQFELFKGDMEAFFK